MTNILLTILGLALACLILSYFFVPARLFDALVFFTRFRAKLNVRYCDVDGHQMPYLMGGAGPPLVLLHGFGADKDHWSVVSRYLTSHFTVYAPDLPGFGDADRKIEASYGREAQIARLKMFLDCLNLSEISLGGSSMGGYLAFMFAHRYPNIVDKLWLLAPAGALSAEPSEFMLALEENSNPLIVETETQLRELARLCFFKPPSIPKNFKKVLLDRSSRVADFNRKVFEEIFDSPLAVEDINDTLQIKSLLVWGNSDKILDCSGIKEFQQKLVRAQTILMRDVGHLPMLEKPRTVAVDFLNFYAEEN